MTKNKMVRISMNLMSLINLMKPSNIFKQLLNLQKNKIQDLTELVNNPAVVNCTIDLRDNPLDTYRVRYQIEGLQKKDVEVRI